MLEDVAVKQWRMVEVGLWGRTQISSLRTVAKSS